MAGGASKVIFILLVLAVTIPCLEAGIAEFDDFLKEQQNEAHDVALKSYVPDPENVTHDINLHVHLYLPLPTLLFVIIN